MLQKEPDGFSLSGWVAAPILVGSLLALAGGYWDDAWHTERGRDAFLIAPHVAVYGGVAMAGAALASWGALAARRLGVHAAVRHPPIVLGLASVALTLASAPIDNAWHVAFGRDAVIWSAPHALGIAGMAGMAAAVLIEVIRSHARWARAAAPVAGALLLTALVFFVVEYDTDVPQFDPLWYLPILATTSALAVAIVRSLAESPWAGTAAAAVHLLLISGVAVFLLALGFPAPQLPLLVAPAAVLDLLSRRATSVLAMATLYVATLFVVYVPVLDALGAGVFLDRIDVLVGAPVAVGGVALVLAALRPAAFPTSSSTVAAAVIAALLLVPMPAYAHDPGQGDDAGSARLDANLNGGRVRLDARLLRPDCGTFGDAAIVARRAGQVRKAPMEGESCRFTGELRLEERGRWFLYAEFHRRAETVESWLPVKVDGGPRRFVAARRYAYLREDRGTSLVQALAAGALYGLIIGFAASVIVLVRRTARGRDRAWPASTTTAGSG